jgi:hypothetical protein
MASIKEKLDIIHRHEADFADALSVEAIERPKLSVWMILIPIVFVWYAYQLQRYAGGRKEFAKHYLLSKQRALDEAFHALDSGMKPDTEHLARLTDLPDDIRPLQAGVLNLLVEHFLGLLRADGDDYDALVRSMYRDRTTYLIFLDRLNKMENEVYAALTAKLTEDGASNAVEIVKRESERLRRLEAERIFP